jgi:hypothetical protein
MSDTSNPIRLELLGEMMRRLQADVRTLRDENKTTRSIMTDRMNGLEETLGGRMAHLEARIDSRIDQLSEVVFAIADKLGVDYRR